MSSKIRTGKEMMTHTMKPLPWRLLYKARTLLHYHLSFKRKFLSMKGRPLVWGIWNVEIVGPDISLGKNCVIVGARGAVTRINTVKYGGHCGRISIGDNVLVMGGVRLSSATGIMIGDDCMLANFCSIADADWHDIHDRTRMIGKTAPVVLEKGVWIGDSAIIGKGVTIGENSIVGAGAVVTKNVPPNVIAAGNPVRVIRKLDPRKIRTMGRLFEEIGFPGEKLK